MEIPDYSDEEIKQDPSAMERLKKLVLEMAQLSVKVELLEEEVATAKKELEQYEQNLVPALMDELDFKELTTTGGIRVEMKKELRGSLPKDEEKRRLAFQYLRETGNDGLIKREFNISYGRDSTQLADAFARKLEELGISEFADVTQVETVNHQSMLKFLRDELRDGHNVPLDKFGAFEQTFARIKRAK